MIPQRASPPSHPSYQYRNRSLRIVLKYLRAYSYPRLQLSSPLSLLRSCIASDVVPHCPQARLLVFHPLAALGVNETLSGPSLPFPSRPSSQSLLSSRLERSHTSSTVASALPERASNSASSCPMLPYLPHSAQRRDDGAPSSCTLASQGHTQGWPWGRRWWQPFPRAQEPNLRQPASDPACTVSVPACAR